MAALNGEYEASYDGKAPKACVEELHFGLWGEDRVPVMKSMGDAWEIHEIHGQPSMGTSSMDIGGNFHVNMFSK